MKSIFTLLVIVMGFVAFPTNKLSALTALPPLNWQVVMANGSKILFFRPDEAVFEIRRTARGSKRDPDTHGYAYALSRSILLTPGWRRVVLEGRWWQQPASRPNYEEMTMEIFGHYPILVHGKSRDGITLENFAEASYDTWNRQIRFEDRGQSAPANIDRMARKIPTSPTPFRWQIDRDPATGEVAWSFFENRSGRWERIYRRYYSKLFQGTDAEKLYWKIGGWCTFERPIATRLHFDRLSYRVLHEIPGPVGSINAKPPLPRQNIREAADDSQILEQNRQCMNEVPIPAFLTPADELSQSFQEFFDRFAQALGDKKAIVAAYYATVPIEEIAAHFRQHIPRSWQKAIDLISPDEGGILAWAKGPMSLQITIKPENGHVVVLIGCGQRPL